MIKKRNGLIVLFILPLSLLTVSLISLAQGGLPHRIGPIYDSPDLDYQPSIIRVEPSGDLMVVFERFGSPPYGDFYVSFSSDDGETWTPPVEILNSPLYERHPSLVQLGPNAFALFYLADETGGGAYRIYRATSSDGLTWTADPDHIDLGWSTPGEINPNVIREENGTLTMTYHRYGGPSYIAQSTDDGITWDTLRTQVSDGSAPLPRLAKRESDGLYIVSYQVNPGGNNLDIYAKLSSDPYDWSGPQIPISTDINSHDSQPIILEDGTFLVTYAKTYAGYFDIFYRTSCDGINWAPEVRVTFDGAHYDTQPHPLAPETPGPVILTWSHQDSVSPYVDHDVWVNTELSVPLGSMEKSVTPTFFKPADALTYTLQIDNDRSCLGGGWLTDPIPTDTTYVPGSLWASRGSYGFDPVNEAITWTGTISTMSQVTITFQVSTTLGLQDGAGVTNTASLTDSRGTTYTLQAIATADGIPPSSTILDPLEEQVISGTSYLVSGVASDTVSGIEQVAVSVDGGAWQPADGEESWTFLWDNLTEGMHNIRSQATDGVGHVEVPNPGITVTVDNTPPVLEAFRPISGAVDVELSAAVVLTFSEPIVTPTLAYVVEPDPGGWSVAWNNEATVATLSHADFAGGTAHTFRLNHASDRALNPITPTQWTFSTLCEPVELLSVTTEISGCVVAFGAELSGTAPFSYSWDFGPFGGSTAPTPTVDYEISGTYPYTLTVRNCGGASSAEMTGTVTVACEPVCLPAEIISVTAEISGCRVAFGAELSGTTPFSYSWDFGPFGGSTVPTPTVDFGENGTYTVTLDVQNPCGEDNRSRVVEVACRVASRIYLPVVIREQE